MMDRRDRRSLVLFSGGQDSTACLAWALNRFPGGVETIGFAYGQRHAAELRARPLVLERLRAEFPRWSVLLGPDHVLGLDVLSQIGGSALTDDIVVGVRPDGLPNTFVPGRNSAVPDRGGCTGRTARDSRSCRRDVRDRLFGLSRLQGRYHFGAARSAYAWNGVRICHSRASDEAGQGRDLAACRGAWGREVGPIDA